MEKEKVRRLFEKLWIVYKGVLFILGLGGLMAFSALLLFAIDTYLLEAHPEAGGAILRLTSLAVVGITCGAVWIVIKDTRW